MLNDLLQFTEKHKNLVYQLGPVVTFSGTLHWVKNPGKSLHSQHLMTVLIGFVFQLLCVHYNDLIIVTEDLEHYFPTEGNFRIPGGNSIEILI